MKLSTKGRYGVRMMLEVETSGVLNQQDRFLFPFPNLLPGRFPLTNQ